jgi:tRNA threonylcarbamoyladenosine biosynthesis protein TsaB
MHPSRTILALDATTSLCSVAWTDGVRWVERSEEAGQRHSELILPMIDAALGEAGCALRDLDEVAFGAGPGSFTGLRIACGIAQGLGFGANVPVRAVSSLLALAQASGAHAALVALDARMGEVYWAAYRRGADDGMSGSGRWRELVAPRVTSPAAVAPPAGYDWVGAGDGFSAYPALGARAGAGAAMRFRDGVRVTARAIAELAQAGEGVLGDAAAAAPQYVRDKVASTVAERAGGTR